MKNSEQTKWSGELSSGDFNTCSPNKNRIENQAYAELIKQRFDKEKRAGGKAPCPDEERYKEMTLEQLREQKIISNTDGRPTKGLTDMKWQREFRLRKMFIKPFDRRIKLLGGPGSRKAGFWNEETRGVYCGDTNWQEYCWFINDVLKTIRSGGEDYCYYIYQIMDLARFHYKDLRTRYEDGYWKVWLQKKGR